MTGWTKTLHNNFQVDQTSYSHFYVVVVFLTRISPPSGQTPLLSFDFKLSSYTSVPSRAKISQLTLKS